MKISTTSAMLHITLGAGMLLMSVVTAFTVYYFVEGPIRVDVYIETKEAGTNEEQIINNCDYNCSKVL